MAKTVLTDVSVTINSVDLSDHISQVTISQEYEVVDTTGFSETTRTKLLGLQEAEVTFSFFQDFATSSVEDTIWPLLGQTTTCVIKPTSGAVSATNPSYTFTINVSNWAPLSGSIGEASTIDVTWPISGTITKATV